MSANKSNPEAPRSKLVELFGSGKAKTLPSVEKAKDEGVLMEKMKTPRTKTIDSIVPSDTHHGHTTSSTPNFTLKKNTSGDRLSSLPKLSRRSSNPRSYQKKIDNTRTTTLQKPRQSTNQSKTFEVSTADSSADRALSPSSESSNPTTRQKEMKKSAKREDRKSSTIVKPQNVTSSRKPSTEDEEGDDGDDVSILRKAKNQANLVRPLPKEDTEFNGSSAEIKGQVAGHGDIDGKCLVEVQPMSPMNRYSGGQQGTSLLSRISQRYIIDPSRHPPNKDLHMHPEQQQQSFFGLKTTTTKMATRDGLTERQTVRMNKSLTESSRRSGDDDDDDDEDRMYCSSSESLSSNNNSSKKGNSMKLSSDGAFFSGQRSSYCSLKTFNNDLSTSGRVRSATNPKARSHELTHEPQPMMDGSQFGFRAGKRYERSNSLSLTGLGSGSSSTNLLPSLTLTSIPEKGLNPEGEEQSYHSQGSTRPKVLDLTQPSLEFGGCYPARQSLDSARFLRLPPEGIGSPHLFPRRQLSQQSSPSTGDGGSICRWNAASSSSSSSLLSPPQQDPRRFHSSLPRSPKSPLGGGLALKYTQEQLRSSGCAKSSATDSAHDKSPRGFSLSASHISHNQELNSQPNGAHRRMFRGQGSLPLPGSQSCCLSRKNQSNVTSPCQQQHQQQQSPLKSLYSLDEDGDLHASVLSLISNTSSSVFSTMTEERQAQEIKRLRHELDTAHEKINSLTNQLNTNVYVVGAFEHSLSTMTNRLQKLTKSSELKDVELAKLKAALEEVERAKGQMSRTFNDQSLEINKQRVGLIIEEERSATLSPQAPQSLTSCESVEGKKKNLLWTKLGHTFKRAFSKKKDGSDSETDVSCSSEFVAATPFKSPDLPCRRHSNHHLAGYRSVPSTPLVSQRRILEFFDSPSSKTNHKALLAKATPAPNNTPAVASGVITPCPANEDTLESEKLIASLKQQLHEKEMGLTDVRLEALSSAHMQEQLRETINQLKMELNQERSENERLRQLLNDLGVSQSKPGNPSRQKSINSTGDDQSKLLIRDPTASYGSLTMDEMKKSVPKYVVTVKTRLDDGKEVLVGSVNLTSKTKWETLDSTVNRIFQEYLYKVDASNTLGLSSKSIAYYRVGELKRSKGDPVPELLPCGYLVGHNTTIVITLNENLGHPGLELTSFESLLSKKCLERYLSLLQSYLNLIIAGPIKSGKTHLAHQLAHCVSWSISSSTYRKAPITYMNVNSVSKEDFQCFLTESLSTTISTSSSSSSSSHSNIVIIILDNLNHSIITSQLFVDFVESCSRKRKYLLGTMLTSEYRSSRDMITAKIQVSVLDSQSEPLQGLLSRHLQRRVIEEEIRQDRKLDADVVRYLKYLVQVCDHLCSFIRDQCCHTVDEIGPALFFSAPLDKNQFQSWFIELWNERIIPHMTFALSNHLKSNTAVHHDPSIWVKENLPWPSQDLLSLTPAPPPDLLMTSPRGRKVKRPRLKNSQSSANDDDDDDDKEEEEYENNNDRDDDDDDRKEGGVSVNADRLINTDAYQLASASSSSSPPPSSSSSSSSSFKSKSASTKTRITTQKSSSSSSSSSLSTQLRANIVTVNDNHHHHQQQQQHHHHHHQFVRSPQVLRKTDGILKQVDPLTNMLHRLQEAAMTSSATPTAGRRDNLFLDDLGVYDNLNNNNNNGRDISTADDINHNSF